MSRSVSCEHPDRLSRAAEMGFRLFYRRNAVNHCPGCGQAQWYIGRVSAECAFCGAALPLQEMVNREARPVRHLGVSGSKRYDPYPA